MSVATVLAPVSSAMIHAQIDHVMDRGYPDGVIALAAQVKPADRHDTTHLGKTLRIRPAGSALAVREALTEHWPGDWMVVLTDRPDEDLGAGILAHLIGQRIRRADPWQAVRLRFHASRIDPELIRSTNSRALAGALLAAAPAEGWPPAPAGTLTRSHALNAVATRHLHLTTDVADAIAVLEWSTQSEAVTALADLRSTHGDELADATLDWIAEMAGTAQAAVRIMLSRGEITDIVPRGLVLHLVADPDRFDAAPDRHAADLALASMNHLWGGTRPSTAALRALGEAAAAVTIGLLERDQRSTATKILQRADLLLLKEAHAEALAVHSDVLLSGLRQRLHRLAAQLEDGVARGSDASTMPAVEQALELVEAHHLARSPIDNGRARVDAFRDATRLYRWLKTTPKSETGDVAVHARQYLDHGAWADRAMDRPFIGVDDPALGSALRSVVTAAQERRRTEEREFAAALKLATEQDAGADDGRIAQESGPVRLLERLLPDVIIPLAKQAPVLLLVMDGMSGAAATEILDDAIDNLGWVEAALPGASRRTAALAVLPTLTKVSRASLLSGHLTTGEQSVERAGYEELTARSGKLTSALFHKAGVDTTVAGSLVAGDVGTSIDDPETDLVTIVLNTIDDALDRDDPAGTVWNAEAIKHLGPLLARARSAGRTVIMTADHGHIVERRESHLRSDKTLTSNRSRPATPPIQDDEIEVAGRRVLAPDNRCVLAVDDLLRYGPMKSGYHGGASAAEATVPVIVLLPDVEDNPHELGLLPPQTPSWWWADTTHASETVPSTATPDRRPKKGAASAAQGPSLFDDLEVEHRSQPTADTAPAQGPGGAVVSSEVFAAQKAVAPRVSVTDDQVAKLVNGLHSARDQRLPLRTAAILLGVTESRARGAISQVQNLLNVEGYPVVKLDVAAGSVILDQVLMRQQFEVS